MSPSETPTITAWLRGDHERIRGLLRELQRAASDISPAGRAALMKVLQRLWLALAVHEEIEESILLPAVRGHSVGKLDGMESGLHAAHEEVRMHVDILRRAIEEDAFLLRPIDAELADINIVLHRHMQQEETRFFPLIEQGLPIEIQADLGRQAEKRAQERLRPRTESE